MIRKDCRRTGRRTIEGIKSDNNQINSNLPSIHLLRNSAKVPNFLNKKPKKHYNDLTTSNLSPKPSEFEILFLSVKCYSNVF